MYWWNELSLSRKMLQKTHQVKTAIIIFFKQKDTKTTFLKGATIFNILGRLFTTLWTCYQRFGYITYTYCGGMIALSVFM